MAQTSRYIEFEFRSDTNRVVVSRLHLSFSIEKTLTSAPSEGKLFIRNLKDSTESFIRNEASKVTVYAGYASRFGVVFSGDIRNTTSKREKLNRVLEVEVGGGVKKLSEAYFQRSYAGTVQAELIVQDALNVAGLAAVNLQALPSITLEDSVWNGRVFDVVDTITERAGISWFEDNERAIFQAPNQSVGVNAIRISQSNGMVGVPELTETGMKAVSVLNPAITLGGRVEVVSAEAPTANGLWKVTKLTLEGDNRTGEHVSKVEGVPIRER